MTTPKRKPKQPAIAAQPAKHDEPLAPVQDEQAPDETEPTGPGMFTAETEQPSEEVPDWVWMVRDHAERGVRTSFQPLHNIELIFGYNGLSRVFSGHRHVHIATVAELAEMSDQAVYDAVMEAGKR